MESHVTKRKAVVSWSGGKDCTLALWHARQQYDIAGLLTTVTREFDRISVHGVRRELLEEQARSLNVPLFVASISHPCSNDLYEAAMTTALGELRRQGVTNVVCGDIFLADVRRYREERLLLPGEGVFPIWGRDSRELAAEFLRLGFRAVVCCVDTQALDGRFAGRFYDEAFLSELPPAVDPCGENGEFHTFVFDGPLFSRPVACRPGERVLRDGRFMFCDLLQGEPSR